MDMKPALFCDLERPIPKMSILEPKLGIVLPMSIPALHKSIIEAQSKKDVIKALRSWVSSRGGFSDAPQALHDKLNDMCKDKH